MRTTALSISAISGFLLLGGMARGAQISPPPRPAGPDPTVRARVLASYGKLPLAFEENRGQTDPRVRFLARGSGFGLFLTAEEAVVRLRDGEGSRAMSLALLGIDPAVRVAGESKLPGKINSLRGADPKGWRTEVSTFSRVRYTGLYPGIDLIFYGQEGQFEHDFIVAPGADPRAIQFAIAGIDSLAVEPSGDLVLQVGSREIRLRKPVAYQEVEGDRRVVASGYRLLQGDGPARYLVGFDLAPYDSFHPLIIDPILGFSTYLGGSGEEQASGIAVDAAGNAYVTGYTLSDDFPVVAALQPVRRSFDAFVTKLDRSGTIVYSTFLGGSGSEIAYGIAVDAAGNAYVTGSTDSTDFPRIHPLQSPLGVTDPGDVFVVKLDPSGSKFLYATNLGGSGVESSLAIAIDSRGHAYVGGYTTSTNFPTVHALVPSLRGVFDGFLAKLSPDGSSLEYSTFVAGNSPVSAVAADSEGHIYIGGSTQNSAFPTVNAIQTSLRGIQDCFVAKLDRTGSSLIYSTYLGGSAFDFGITGIAVDEDGNAYLVGYTPSADFPILHAIQPNLRGPSDAFVTKLSPQGALIYSTYLGGSWLEVGAGIAVDRLGNAYVAGSTNSADFPLKNASQNQCLMSAGLPPLYCAGDVFVTVLNAQGSGLIYSTFLGGNYEDRGTGIALDSSTNVYVTGVTQSQDFPILHAAQPEYKGRFDTFVTKIMSHPSPDCSAATAAPAAIWPPNHKLIPVAIQGVTDPEGDPVTIQITGISQDEPLAGNTPDATGLGSATAQVRAERAGGGDGRVYHLTFTASDPQGASCTGTVAVCVPHDPGHGPGCGDGGALYNSNGTGR